VIVKTFCSNVLAL